MAQDKDATRQQLEPNPTMGVCTQAWAGDPTGAMRLNQGLAQRSRGSQV